MTEHNAIGPRTTNIPAQHRDEIAAELKKVSGPMRRALYGTIDVYFETHRHVASPELNLVGAKTIATLSAQLAQHLPSEQAESFIVNFRGGLRAEHAQRQTLTNALGRFLNTSDSLVKAQSALELSAALPGYLQRQPSWDQVRERIVYALEHNTEGMYIDVPRVGRRLDSGKVELSYAVTPEALRAALNTLLEQPTVPELTPRKVRTLEDSQKTPGALVECFIDGKRTFVPEADTVGVPGVSYWIEPK